MVEKSHLELLQGYIDGYIAVDEAQAALDKLEEQLGVLHNQLGGESMRCELAEGRLARAEAFIAHQGMEYRFAEWCGGVASNPASKPEKFIKVQIEGDPQKLADALARNEASLPETSGKSEGGLTFTTGNPGSGPQGLTEAQAPSEPNEASGQEGS